MKIFLINQAHPLFGGPGGAERSVKTLADGLAARGHDVTSLAMAQSEDTRHLSENGIHSEHHIAGVRTVLFGKVKRTPSEVDMMVQLIDRDRPQVVHTNTFWHNVELWNALAARNIPVVHTLREYKLACQENMYRDGQNCEAICDQCELRARLNQARSASVGAVVGISRYVLDRHIQLGFFARTAAKSVIPNPVVIGPPAEKRSAAAGKAVRLGYLGRLHPTKGIDLLIDAVLGRRDDAITLTVAGAIQDHAIDKKLAGAEGDPRFEYLGFVDPADLFAKVDVLVVPSRWPEPFGRIAVEAFGHGVPVLAANFGGLREIVEQGKTGWLFSPDAEGIAAGLDEVLRDRGAIKTMRDACLAAAQRYAPSRIAAEYESVYEKTIKAHANGKQRSSPLGGIGAKLISPRSWIKSRPREVAHQALKVLVVTGEFPKLSETFVINHITGLIDQGADVSIFCERLGPPDQWHDDVDTYRLMDRCLWYGMPPSLQPARDQLCANSREIQQDLAKLMKACSVLSMPPPLDQLARAVVDEQARTDFKLRLFHAAQVLVASRKEFDIVHTHFGHRGLLAADLKRMKALTGRIVVNFHGIDLTEHIQRKGAGIYDGLKSECSLYLPISNFFRERLLQLGISPRLAEVHHVGVNCEKFRFMARTRSDGEKLHVLTVGRLVPKKGVEYAIRAMGTLKKRSQLTSLHYDIVGDGPERAALERLVAELKIKDQVTFHGSAPHHDVVKWMERSHLFLAPSVTGPDGDMEGIPTTIMEAMASGMPVISTRHSGIPELVKDKENGMLCPERDFEALAGAIHFLAANPELWSDFSRAGRRLVEKEFNINVQTRRLMKMYEDLVVSTGDTPKKADAGQRVTA